MIPQKSGVKVSLPNLPLEPLGKQPLMGALEWILFLQPSPEGSGGAPVYYDPRYDSQSNFPAAETQVERLLF